MGTTCTLVAVVPRHRQAAARKALRDAEATLRMIEARMSSWIEASEVSQFNNGSAGREITLSKQTRQVLLTARQVFEETSGAFDVTCRPLIELWRKASNLGVLPSSDKIDNARSASSWQEIQLTETGIQKNLSSTRVDLGGIAKGYAIDAAIGVFRRAGINDGYVDVGGDERLIGLDARGKPWSVAVRNPFGEGVLLELHSGEAAVCTSGNYARFFVIDGKRHGHIINPRTGQPVTDVASVTVLAPTAMVADIWATALSVLGPSGFEKLPDGVEALIITGGPDDVRQIATPGMQNRLPRP